MSGRATTYMRHHSYTGCRCSNSINNKHWRHLFRMLEKEDHAAKLVISFSESHTIFVIFVMNSCRGTVDSSVNRIFMFIPYGFLADQNLKHIIVGILWHFQTTCVECFCTNLHKGLLWIQSSYQLHYNENSSDEPWVKLSWYKIL